MSESGERRPPVDDAASPAIGLLIADDQRLVRDGLRVILDRQAGFTVLGEAADGRQASAGSRAASRCGAVRYSDAGAGRARRRPPDHRRGPSRVLVLTTFDADDYIYEALRIGASGFLLKDAPPDQLVTAIRAAATGDALIDPSVTRRLVAAFTRAVRPAARILTSLEGLTARELDVLRLIAAGHSNAEIAADLFVAESTVKSHVARILLKLGLRDRVQALVLAYETGFVTPDLPGPDRHGRGGAGRDGIG